MPAPIEPEDGDPDRSATAPAGGNGARFELGTLGGVIGAAVLVAVCCAGPALLATGTLAAVGGWLSNPWLIVAAAVVLAGAVVRIARHHRAAACRTPRDRHPHLRR